MNHHLNSERFINIPNIGKLFFSNIDEKNSEPYKRHAESLFWSEKKIHTLYFPRWCCVYNGAKRVVITIHGEIHDGKYQSVRNEP